MPKDKNVNIRLELSRADNGKLRIIAHFNSKAPNVFTDKNEYIWVPTVEEKDLINEAFSFIPSSFTSDNSKKVSSDNIRPEIKEKTKARSEIETIFEKEPELETKTEEPVEKFAEPSVFERLKEDSVFEVTNHDEPEDDTRQKTEETKNEMKPKIEVKEEYSSNKKDEIIDEDDGLIVEADEEAIREALKKHEKDDDEFDDSIREVDEKTIIDRVLSQKKKGKWARK